MTTHLIWLTIILGVCPGTLAQFITERSHLNSVSEDEARKVASELIIGMSQKEAIQQLATNSLHPTSSTRDSNQWSAIYCFTNGQCDLWLEFRQKPGPAGLIMESKPDYSTMFTLETTEPFVAMTNGILHAVLFRNVQIARTNEPATMNRASPKPVTFVHARFVLIIMAAIVFGFFAFKYVRQKSKAT